MRIFGQDVSRLSTQRQQSVFKLGSIAVEVHGQKKDANPTPLPTPVPPAGAGILVNGVPAIVGVQPIVPVIAPLPPPIIQQVAPLQPPVIQPATLLAQLPGIDPAQIDNEMEQP